MSEVRSTEREQALRRRVVTIEVADTRPVESLHI